MQKSDANFGGDTMGILTRLDTYSYRIQEGFADPDVIVVKVIVNGNTDPIIADIEANLIESDNEAYVEGIFFHVRGTEMGHIGSATVLLLKGLKQSRKVK